MLAQPLAEIEDGQGQLSGRRIEAARLIETPLHVLRFPPHLGRLRVERGLVDGPGEEGVEEPILHVRQLRLALGQGGRLLGHERGLVAHGVLNTLAEPVGHLGVGEADRFEVLDDGILDSLLRPPDPRMVLRLVVISASVVHVDIVAAVLQALANPLAGDPVPTAAAAKDAPGQHDLRLARAPVPAARDVLAALKEHRVDEDFVPPTMDRPIAVQLPDVEPVVENVGESRPTELRLGVEENVAFGMELVGQRLERVVPRPVQFEEADERFRFLRVRHDRLVLILDVHVPEGREIGRPTLADLLVHPLQYLGAQVVGVVLRDGRHHVEGKRTGGTGAELVLDEGELHAAGVFEFLEADGVAHVAADPVELGGKDRLDLFPLRVGLHPAEHFVEDFALRPALGRLGDDELADHSPA